MTDDGGVRGAANDRLNERLGEHLRKLRRQKGLSLLDVQSLSDGAFKASVMGAYERGERAISALRLAALADLYRLPLQAMLPTSGAEQAPGSGVAIDIGRLDDARGPEAKTIARFVRRVQAQRHDWAGGVVRIRADDVVALACACDRSVAELMKVLDDEGLRAF